MLPVFDINIRLWLNQFNYIKNLYFYKLFYSIFSIFILSIFPLFHPRNYLNLIEKQNIFYYLITVICN